MESAHSPTRATPSLSLAMPAPPTPSAAAASEGNPYPQTWLGPQPSYATKSDKIVCVMVGLPARGKSYIAKRLAQYIQFFYGAPTRVFNVGDYRRLDAGGSVQSADFFDHKNREAMQQRHKASEAALADLTDWMGQVAPHRLDPSSDLYLSGDFGCVAIFDATNSTRERRASDTSGPLLGTDSSKNSVLLTADACF